ESASAGVREFRARARQVCAGRKGAFNERRDSSLERPVGDESGSRPPRIPEGRNVRRRGGVRSGKNQDNATFEKPHQYAAGVKHVFVNGVQVIKDGEHTGAKPGRALWGPGKVK